ncbi:helix-turn-helix transcriptional regulator [Bacteroides acidifaciens]|jgi:transcriptional regulator with XRE-family HTH domain|uniref:helix-turn-helix domain-containing protein n=1 Tax=Bacteroides acidifaciens TaxID=85831 RepID=UPI00321FC090
MMLFGKMIKKLREDQGLLQRQIAYELDIDTPMYSKFERGERLPKREQIEIIAKILLCEERELRVLWLADKILDKLREDSDVVDDTINEVRKVVSQGH